MRGSQRSRTGYAFSRRAILRAGASLSGSLAVGSLVGPAQAAARQSNGKPFTYAYKSDVATLDPHMTTDTTTQNVVFQMFEPLVQIDRKQGFEGVLAERWENVDDRTWKFYLRKGVKFHNGEPCNAAAVKYSYDRILDPALKSPEAPSLAPIDHVQVIDDATVALVTKEPYAATLSIGTVIVPPQYIKEKGNDGFAANPVGTGPFTFVERQKDVHVKMKGFAQHWRGAPAISDLTFRPIPEDSSRIAALQNGEVDWIAAVDVDRVEDVESGGDLRTAVRPGQAIYGGLDTLKTKPLMDKRVRQAINYGVNMDSIIQYLLDNKATRLPSVLFTETPGFDPKMKPYPHDPDKAKQLLADAGYPDGFEVTLSLPVGIQATQKFQEVGEAIAQDLGDVGIKAKISVVDPGTAFDHYRAGEYQFYLYPWGSSHESGIYVETLLKSDTRGYYYKNPDADKLISEFMSTIDPTKRAAVGKQMNEFFFDDCPWLFMYQEPDIYGYRKGVNWEPNPRDIYFKAYEVTFS